MLKKIHEATRSIYHDNQQIHDDDDDDDDEEEEEMDDSSTTNTESDNDMSMLFENQIR